MAKSEVAVPSEKGPPHVKETLIGAPSNLDNVVPTDSSGGATKSTNHRSPFQRLVLGDPVAFRYLEEDPSTTVLERRHRLTGYELYIVEAWACSRDQPTFVIATYTGDSTHSALVNVLGLPTDETAWSPRLKFYMKAVSQVQAHKRETPVGSIMVTSLSEFPSHLSIIHVPDGDLRKHREDFIVNTDLKRMGCSGRMGPTLASPANPTQAKFYSIFKISDHIPFSRAVIEMIKLCQIALTLFGVLSEKYADGLLCDVTETAVRNWWIEVGIEQYNLETSDGAFSPTTVAALLGLLMGARSRLSTYGAPVSKDPFDVPSMKRGIAYFQKYQKMTRTRRLDRQTLNRLHRVTAKAASGEGWRVQKAMKTTVAELKGKGEDFAIDMAGAREKSTIADIETTDIEQFAELVKGDRAKWLWKGHSRKPIEATNIDDSETDVLAFQKDEHEIYKLSRSSHEGPSEPSSHVATKANSDLLDPGDTLSASGSPVSQEDPLDRDIHTSRMMFKSVAGKMNDARSGFGRIKDAVTLPSFRTHHPRNSKDDYSNPLPQFPKTKSEQSDGFKDASQSTAREKPTTLGSLADLNTQDTKPPTSPDEKPSIDVKNKFEHSLRSWSSEESIPSPVLGSMSERQRLDDKTKDQTGSQPRQLSVADLSVNGSVDQSFAAALSTQLGQDFFKPVGISLRRSMSSGDLPEKANFVREEAKWPRRLSFSVAEEAILDWKTLNWAVADLAVAGADDAKILEILKGLYLHGQLIRTNLSNISLTVGSWVEKSLRGVETIDAGLAVDQERLATLYYQRLEEYDNLQTASTELLNEERNQLSDALQEIETLGAKLKYELSSLSTKVDDVEEGVAEFEKQVRDVEEKTQGLEPKKHPESWTTWAFRLLTGVGPLVNEA